MYLNNYHFSALAWGGEKTDIDLLAYNQIGSRATLNDLRDSHIINITF
jgi:hypothetical protein